MHQLLAKFTESQIQRLVWIGRGLEDHLVPCHGQGGTLPLDQVVQNPIQHGLKDFQEWDFHK